MGDANQRWADAGAGVGVATVGVGLGVGVWVGVGVTDAVGVGVAEAVGVGVKVGVAVAVGIAVKVGVPSTWWCAEVGAPPTARTATSPMTRARAAALSAFKALPPPAVLPCGMPLF